MNTLLKLYEGQTTLLQDVVFIFGAAALLTGWLAIYAGREPWGTPYGLRFFAPLWLLDAPRHWKCYRHPHWWAPPILAAACAAWLLLGHLIQNVSPGLLGFKATTWHEWPMPFVIHKHRAAAIAFHAFQWFAGNIALSALSRALLPHNQLALIFLHALRVTFAKIELNATVKQTTPDKVILRYRAPVIAGEITRAKNQIAAAMGAGIKIAATQEIKPSVMEIKFGVEEPIINNYAKSTSNETEYVYFIRYKLSDCEVVKIGRSNSPENTLRACRRFVPSSRLVGALAFSETVSENKIHALFADERLEHESGDESEVFAMSPRIESYLSRAFPSHKV